MLFGSKSEKASKVLPSSKKDSDKSDQDPPDDENGAASAGGDRVKISHQSLRHEDPCTECPKGKVHLQQNPGIIVHVCGTAPLQATIYELEKLRCNLCGAIFTAEAPEQVGREIFLSVAGAPLDNLDIYSLNHAVRLINDRYSIRCA